MFDWVYLPYVCIHCRLFARQNSEAGQERTRESRVRKRTPSSPISGGSFRVPCVKRSNVNKTTILVNFTLLFFHRPTIKEIFHLKKTSFLWLQVYVYGLELFDSLSSRFWLKKKLRVCSNKSFIITWCILLLVLFHDVRLFLLLKESALPRI